MNMGQWFVIIFLVVIAAACMYRPKSDDPPYRPRRLVPPNPNDRHFCRMAFNDTIITGETTLPSGWKVPLPKEGYQWRVVNDGVFAEEPIEEHAQ